MITDGEALKEIAEMSQMLLKKLRELIMSRFCFLTELHWLAMLQGLGQFIY